ncbi:hypothetical protein VMCG_07246 [Cytospora schulzeri]|uniref:Uncharacterized protein n=1 Tax=Cytospora schulzeri TaxID=448051 RepID=A0A423WAJ2_9PEZI|nr:hypothetical protein VMCG_07246 [Valsa malicola]
MPEKPTDEEVRRAEKERMALATKAEERVKERQDAEEANSTERALKEGMANSSEGRNSRKRERQSVALYIPDDEEVRQVQSERLVKEWKAEQGQQLMMMVMMLLLLNE